MKMLFNAFGKKLFGVRYERVGKALLLSFIIYGALHSAEIHLTIAPIFFYLTSCVFTAGIMWQSLNSGDNVKYYRNMMMMPFEGKEYVISYVGALGGYVLITKTFSVWALFLAAGSFEVAQIILAVVCAFTGIILATVMYVLVRHIKDGAKIDAYIFYADIEGSARKAAKSHNHGFVWAYLSRYLMAHKNYLFNSFFIWGLAFIIPALLVSNFDNGYDFSMLLAVGLGVVSINTPLTILVSCDPDLERGIRAMPDGLRKFFIPYGLFLFVNYILAYSILLVSWELQIGGLGILHILSGVLLAMISAAVSSMLEWRFPLKSWKIESDLWHHPRKYIVPASVILMAGLMGTFIW